MQNTWTHVDTEYVAEVTTNASNIATLSKDDASKNVTVTGKLRDGIRIMENGEVRNETFLIEVLSDIPSYTVTYEQFQSGGWDDDEIEEGWARHPKDKTLLIQEVVVVPTLREFAPIMLWNPVRDVRNARDHQQVPREYPMPNGWFRFTDGGFGTAWTGKYKPGILLVNPKEPRYPVVDTTADLNFGYPIRGARGTFFITKKGKDAFRIDPNGEHLWYDYSWSSTYTEPPTYLWYKNARSNGGRAGHIYVIVDLNKARTVDLADM